MFSEELQKLIDASLVDGVITDKERAVIHKRAVQEGVDPDEVDVILEANVAKIRQTQESAVKKVKKCPNCGEVIPVMATSCKSCGYEFRNLEVSNSIKTLFAKLNSLESQRKEELNDARIDEDPIVIKKKEIIRSFPVPNTKEDIIEFLSLALPNAKRKGGIISSGIGRFLVIYVPCLFLAPILYNSFNHIEADETASVGAVLGFGLLFFGFFMAFFYAAQGSSSMNIHNAFVDVWKAKFEQVISKAKYSMADDPIVISMINKYENQEKMERQSLIKGYGVLAGIFIIGLFYIIFSGVGFSSSESNEDVNKQYTELCKKIENLGIPSVENYNMQKYELLKITWEPIKGGGKYEKEMKKLYLEKKRSYARQLDAFHQEHYKEIGDNSIYEQTDEIQFPSQITN